MHMFLIIFYGKYKIIHTNYSFLAWLDGFI